MHPIHSTRVHGRGDLPDGIRGGGADGNPLGRLLSEGSSDCIEVYEVQKITLYCCVVIDNRLTLFYNETVPRGNRIEARTAQAKGRTRKVPLGHGSAKDGQTNHDRSDQHPPWALITKMLGCNEGAGRKNRQHMTLLEKGSPFFH